MRDASYSAAEAVTYLPRQGPTLRWMLTTFCQLQTGLLQYRSLKQIAADLFCERFFLAVGLFSSRVGRPKMSCYIRFLTKESLAIGYVDTFIWRKKDTATDDQSISSI